MEGRVPGDPISWPHTEVPHGPLHEVDHIGVGDHYSFGDPGGAGGKEDVCRILTAVPRLRRLRRASRQIVETELGAARSRIDLGFQKPHRGYRQRGVA
jgi:hypothetical protein